MIPIPLHHLDDQNHSSMAWQMHAFDMQTNDYIFVLLFACILCLFCHIAVLPSKQMSVSILLLKIRCSLHHFIIFSQTLNKSIVLFHLENAEFCILIQAWTILYFAFTI